MKENYMQEALETDWLNDKIKEVPQLPDNFLSLDLKEQNELMKARGEIIQNNERYSKEHLKMVAKQKNYNIYKNTDDVSALWSCIQSMSEDYRFILEFVNHEEVGN
jgi:hypothetical protein